MSETYGQKANLGICFQDSYGTSNTSSMHWIEFMSEDVVPKKEALKSQNMRGIFEEGDAYEGKNSADGNLEAEAHPITLGVFLTAIFGAPTTVNSDGIYTHTWQPSQTDFDDKVANIPFTLYKDLNDGGSASLLYDLNGATLELGVANGEFLKSTLGVVGGNFEQLAALTPSFPNGKRWTWDVSSVTFGNSEQTGLADLSLTINDGVEALHSLAASRGKWPARLKRTGFRTFEVSGTMRFDNQDEMQEFLSFNERKLDVSFTGPTEIQSGYYETLQIVMPAMLYTDFPAGASGPGLIEVGFSANGNYHTGSGTAMEITLVNTKAAYV